MPSGSPVGRVERTTLRLGVRLLGLFWSQAVAAQSDSSTGLPLCNASTADTAGWKDVPSTIAPVRMIVPPGLVLASSSADTSTALAIHHQIWYQDSTLLLNMTRIQRPAIPGLRPVPIRSPSRQVMVCRVSSGGLEATVEVRRALRPPRGTEDSSAVYMMTATFALGANDDLRLDGMTQSEPNKQRLLAIIQSLHPAQDKSAHR
jgi:hypothetical protein